MKLTDVYHIVEVKRNDCNTLVKQGWSLISTYTFAPYPTDTPHDLVQMYSVGATKEVYENSKQLLESFEKRDSKPRL